jgi:hypothetical protein
LFRLSVISPIFCLINFFKHFSQVSPSAGGFSTQSIVLGEVGRLSKKSSSVIGLLAMFMTGEKIGG